MRIRTLLAVLGIAFFCSCFPTPAVSNTEPEPVVKLANQFLTLIAEGLEPVTVSPVDRDSLLPKQAALLDSDAPEIMFSGAFGCGKSYGLCLKVFDLAWRYSGNRVGLFRSTLKSLRATTLRTLLDGDGALPPAIPPGVVAAHNKNEQIIKLKNGSEIVYGGLQSSTRSRTWFNSLNLGAAAVDQAEELSFDEWRLLQGRLRLKLPYLPHHQIFGACNPRHPGHWIYQRFFIEKPAIAALIKSNTFDNPFLPPDYVARLETFTGPFYRRFVLGEWVGLEGLVYDNFDPTVHLVEPFPVPANWQRWRAIDFGYQNPFVCLWAVEVGADNAGELPEGSLVVYREIYMSHRRVTLHGSQISDLSAGESYRTSYADHDAGGRAELVEFGINTQAAVKEIETGIQTVRRWLGNEPGLDGQTVIPRLYFFRGALVERDARLTLDPVTGDKVHAPVCTADEFSFYRWPQGSDGRAKKEQPVKVHDHGMDALRYLLASMERPPAEAEMYVHVSEQVKDLRDRY
jgi:phage terminase large subunit